MPDYLGNIQVPEVIPSGVFPLVPDYPHGRAPRPEVVIHQFGSANAKIEQRFLLGNVGTGIKLDLWAEPLPASSVPAAPSFAGAVDNRPT